MTTPYTLWMKDRIQLKYSSTVYYSGNFGFRQVPFDVYLIGLVREATYWAHRDMTVDPRVDVDVMYWGWAGYLYYTIQASLHRASRSPTTDVVRTTGVLFIYYGDGEKLSVPIHPEQHLLTSIGDKQAAISFCTKFRSV